MIPEPLTTLTFKTLKEAAKVWRNVLRSNIKTS